MDNSFSVSIVLPTFNEEKSLRIFIPQLVDVLKGLNYEIIVVDDNSNDETQNIVKNFSINNKKIKLINRRATPSLPMSILEGVKNSQNEFVMWLDADGSMDAESLINLINFTRGNHECVYIGSRFVDGGGYKGKQRPNQFRLKKFIKSINKSEDSFLAIFLSLIFNKVLSILLNVGVKDLTSGFIIGKREFFNESMFKGFTYGEYFISVVTNLYLKKINIVEVGYFCKPRVFGESKTSTNIFKLLTLSIPYIRTAINCRKQLNANLR